MQSIEKEYKKAKVLKIFSNVFNHNEYCDVNAYFQI